MSETDDTDVLLLIPPNFFLVQSSDSEDSLLESSRTVVHKPQSCTAQVLGQLVNQVHTLESRLESLEANSDLSSVSTLIKSKTWDTSESIDDRSLDRKCYTFPRRRKKKLTKKQRSRDLSLTSLDSLSTVVGSIPPLDLDYIETFRPKLDDIINDIQNMDGDVSSIVSTPSKKNDRLLLHEIDEFLTKVESYETPETNFKDVVSTVTSENVIKATGDYIAQKLDNTNSVEDVKLPSGRVVPSNILDKYIYLVKNGAAATKLEKPLNTSYKSCDRPSVSNVESASKVTPETSKQDNRSPINRKLNFCEKDVPQTSTPKKNHTSYLDSFRPSSNKIYDRASKVLEQYKAQSYSRNTQTSVTDSYSSPKKEEFKMPQMRPYYPEIKDGMRLASLQNKYMETVDTDLLSLSELWGDRGDRVERGDSVKLEEEKLKREHCESMIQQLQKKILDQQERLAVAVKVDRAKDAAINKLREAWLRLTGNLDKAEERHRQALEKMVREVENFRMVADDAQKKTSHFETELYKALDLAHDYQEKCKHQTAEKKELEQRMNKSLLERDEVIARKDKEIEALKENYETVMRLNKQSTDCVKNLEDALEREKSDHEQTRNSTNDLARKIQSLNDQMSIIVQERDLLKEKVNEERSRGNLLENQLAEKQNQSSDLLKKCDFLDSEVKNLRKHLELQKAELKSHYQKQLEDAVMAKLQEFQQQLDMAEKEMESDARSKEISIVDTYNKQISRIEEQHKLEINVLEEKQKEEIKLYRLQLAQASEKIGLLESKLEAYRRRRGQMASQLHGVMEAQWRQALLILTNGHQPAALDASAASPSRPDSVSTLVGPEYPKVPPLSLPDRGLVRPERADRPDRAERLDRADRGDLQNKLLDALTDDELQQYVKLLLTRPAALGGGGGEGARPQRPELAERHERAPQHKPPWKA